MFSVIVCTYNRDAYIYNTLKCIATNDFPTNDYEIVVVNNNSTDNTEQECIRFRNDFTKTNFLYIIEHQQGLSFARNRGIQESKGDFVIFLDDDAYVASDYLKNLRQVLLQQTDIFAFGGKITPLYESGKEPYWMSPRLAPVVSAIDLGNDVIQFPKNSYPIGANMGFRRSCIEQVGYFNTSLGRTKKNLIGGEEKDFFARIRDSKLAIYYVPTALAQHVIPASRTTEEYVVKMAYGVGASEILRCDSFSKKICAIMKELYKWLGTIALWLIYMLKGKFDWAKMIVRFRWNVSKGLLTYKV